MRPRLVAVTVVVVALLVLDFLAAALHLPADQQRGWGTVSGLGLVLFVCYVLWGPG